MGSNSTGSVPKSMVREVLATYAKLLRKGDPFELEVALSQLLGELDQSGPGLPRRHDPFVVEFLAAIAEVPRADALAFLRTAAAVTIGPVHDAAHGHAERLAAAGVEDVFPPGSLGVTTAARAWLCSDHVDDDLAIVAIEWHHPGARPPDATLTMIDQTAGGMAVSAAAMDSVASCLAALDELPGELTTREIDVETACGLAVRAMEWADMTIGGPEDEAYTEIRSLIIARLARTGVVARDDERPSEDEREAWRTAFLSSQPDGVADPETLEDVAFGLAWFACDYVTGEPWRFSPAMVERFCLDWAPRKMTTEPEILEAIPSVLAAWIRFCGARRGLPADRVEAAVAVIDECRDGMLAAASDPTAWGPAKMLVQSMQAQGVDVHDAEALQRALASGLPGPAPSRRERRAKKPRRKR